MKCIKKTVCLFFMMIVFSSTSPIPYEDNFEYCIDFVILNHINLYSAPFFTLNNNLSFFYNSSSSKKVNWLLESLFKVSYKSSTTLIQSAVESCKLFKRAIIEQYGQVENKELKRELSDILLRLQCELRRLKKIVKRGGFFHEASFFVKEAITIIAASLSGLAFKSITKDRSSFILGSIVSYFIFKSLGRHIKKSITR